MVVSSAMSVPARAANSSKRYHSADYAARRIMPTSAAEAPLEAASGTKESA
jgi:hypothetical protein